MQTTITVRIPEKVREDAELLVKEGYFKNLSDVIVTAIRNQSKEYSPSKAVREIREFRDQTWKKLLKKADGDYEKAAKMYDKEIEKSRAASELKKIMEAKGKIL